MDLQERDEFLDTLRRLLQDAGERRGCFLVGGEAGVGKTALLRRLTVEARSIDIAGADSVLRQRVKENALRDQLSGTVLARL
jgi:predicted ATP-dependent serine protease